VVKLYQQAYANGENHHHESWLGATHAKVLLADPTVDPLPEQVGVAVVPGVLLDHVHHDATHSGW
jgi:hypothetical protein